MDSVKNIRNDLPNPDDTIIDAEIWKHDSQELHDLAETIVNRHARFAWLVVETWCNKHSQHVIDGNYNGKE